MNWHTSSGWTWFPRGHDEMKIVPTQWSIYVQVKHECVLSNTANYTRTELWFTSCMLRCLWKCMFDFISFFSGTGLYAIVFRTANFKQDVTRNKDDTSTFCTAFHIKSKLLFSRQLFLDWHMCQNSCSNLSDQVEAYCTVKRSSLLISLGPFPSVHALKLDWHPNCSDTQSNLDDIH